MPDRLNYGHIESMLGKPFDPVFAFLQRAPYMIEEARTKGQADVHSYRNFSVAGSFYAINSSEKIAWVDSAGNLKRESKNKICTERKLEGRARKYGMTDTIGAVILGTGNREQIREVSGLPTPTLHLCSACRHDLPASPLISPSSLIIHGCLDSDVNQAFAIGQEVNMYARAEKGVVDPKLFKAHDDLTDWDQRVQTYQALSGGAEATKLSLAERLRLAQLAINREVTIF